MPLASGGRQQSLPAVGGSALFPDGIVPWGMAASEEEQGLRSPGGKESVPGGAPGTGAGSPKGGKGSVHGADNLRFLQPVNTMKGVGPRDEPLEMTKISLQDFRLPEDLEPEQHSPRPLPVRASKNPERLFKHPQASSHHGTRSPAGRAVHAMERAATADPQPQRPARTAKTADTLHWKPAQRGGSAAFMPPVKQRPAGVTASTHAFLESTALAAESRSASPRHTAKPRCATAVIEEAERSAKPRREGTPPPPPRTPAAAAAAALAAAPPEGHIEMRGENVRSRQGSAGPLEPQPFPPAPKPGPGVVRAVVSPPPEAAGYAPRLSGEVQWPPKPDAAHAAQAAEAPVLGANEADTRDAAPLGEFASPDVSPRLKHSLPGARIPRPVVDEEEARRTLPRPPPAHLPAFKSAAPSAASGAGWGQASAGPVVSVPIGISTLGVRRLPRGHIAKTTRVPPPPLTAEAARQRVRELSPRAGRGSPYGKVTVRAQRGKAAGRASPRREAELVRTERTLAQPVDLSPRREDTERKRGSVVEAVMSSTYVASTEGEEGGGVGLQERLNKSVRDVSPPKPVEIVIAVPTVGAEGSEGGPRRRRPSRARGAERLSKTAGRATATESHVAADWEIDPQTAMSVAATDHGGLDWADDEDGQGGMSASWVLDPLFHPHTVPRGRPQAGYDGHAVFADLRAVGLVRSPGHHPGLADRQPGGPSSTAPPPPVAAHRGSFLAQSAPAPVHRGLSSKFLPAFDSSRIYLRQMMDGQVPPGGVKPGAPLMSRMPGGGLNPVFTATLSRNPTPVRDPDPVPEQRRSFQRYDHHRSLVSTPKVSGDGAAKPLFFMQGNDTMARLSGRGAWGDGLREIYEIQADPRAARRLKHERRAAARGAANEAVEAQGARKDSRGASANARGDEV
ncbi:unnamed protein product [Pedinophyceae sp. YPF-701]|nr:unnamed protein product [Pedinophyceae sp. YPF-701]